MYIGEIVRKYREEHHISLRAFAEKCNGISHGYLAALEAGKNSNTGKPSQPSIDKLEAIAKGMDITIAQLYAMMNDELPESAAPSMQNIFAGRAGQAEPFSQKVADLIESEIQARVEEQMKGKADPIDDPDDWIPLAPGFDKMPPAFQHDFKVAVNNVWKLYHDLTNQQRKDEPQ